ncbi:MAG: L-threonylcarbamoyladenylate synthase [Patescibacteria group bacterium]|nr:L-threonylcarbamoyladenylate synthase [Patescibacteria group bacterium]
MEDKIWQNENLITTLSNGGVVVMPTDTIYGIVGKAESRETVEHIYEIRRRSPDKSCIILISDISEVKKFGVETTSEQEKEILNIEDKPTSFILDCDKEEFIYLHRSLKTLAFRIPKEEGLKELLRQTGPLIAPSANIEGSIPAKNIQEAKEYFGEEVDIYIDGGEIISEASRIVKIERDGKVTIIRV